MIGSTRSHRRPAGRLFALLVLAVPAGLLSMHALAPGGTATTAAQDTRHPTATAHGSHEEERTGTARAESGDDSDGGHRHHLDHADATCAAAGVACAYEPPPPAAALPGPAAAAAVTSAVPASAVAGRAPPDLAELRLLRI
jgi:hypothetical protein